MRLINFYKAVKELVSMNEHYFEVLRGYQWKAKNNGRKWNVFYEALKFFKIHVPLL